MLKAMWNDENGAIVSIEMILIITIAVLALIVGWTEVAAAVNSELDDISNAIGKFDQSFFFTGYGSFKADGVTPKAFFHGSTFVDLPDECDSCLGNSSIVCHPLGAPGAGG